VGDHFDPLPLYKLADIVLSDPQSGACLDALSLEKPVIMLGAFFGSYDIVFSNGDGSKVIVKKKDIIPQAEDPGQLKSLIAKTINNPGKINERLLYLLFYHRDGKAGERAAEAILEGSKYPQLSMPEKFEKAIKEAPDETTRKNIILKKREYLSGKSLFGRLKRLF
jgi:hypothetical protein